MRWQVVAWALGLGLLGVSNESVAQVVFERAGSTAGSGTTITLASFNASGQADRLLVVGVSMPSGTEGTSVAFGGQSLTRQIVEDADGARSEIWILVNPPATTGSVTLTLSVGKPAVLGAALFSNVHQTSPIRQQASSSAASGTTATVSLEDNILPQNQSFNSVAVIGLLSNVSSLVTEAPNVERYEFSTNAAPGVRGAGGSVTGVSTATMRWRWSVVNPLNPAPHAITAIEIIEAKPPPDTDGDGVRDGQDLCSGTPAKAVVDSNGCSDAQVDSDGDGTCDPEAPSTGPSGCSGSDGCPDDPGKAAPGACGCGVADDDGDGDGTADCVDGCPGDAGKVEPGVCGCGVVDDDSDGDGVTDCLDDCPQDSDKVEPGVCGCGVADDDSDGDGTADCLEDCIIGTGDDADGDGICGNADACPLEDATGLDADRDGCVDNLMGLNALIGQLGPEEMASEIKGSFTAKVRAVARTAGNNTICAAVNILEGFQNAVAAHRGRKIDETTAGLLTAYVDNVIAQLSAQLPEGATCGV